MTLKKQVFDDPNKMHFESPLKAFNQQTVLISCGNVVAPTQYSSHIRSYTNTTMPFGDECEPGHLQNFDLCTFMSHFSLSTRTITKVKDLTHDEPGILYLFYHYTREGTRIDDGLVLTDIEHTHLWTWYLNHDWRAQEAVTEARRYIAHAESLPGYRPQEEEEGDASA